MTTITKVQTTDSIPFSHTETVRDATLSPTQKKIVDFSLKWFTLIPLFGFIIDGGGYWSVKSVRAMQDIYTSKQKLATLTPGSNEHTAESLKLELHKTALIFSVSRVSSSLMSTIGTIFIILTAIIAIIALCSSPLPIWLIALSVIFTAGLSLAILSTEGCNIHNVIHNDQSAYDQKTLEHTTQQTWFVLAMFLYELLIDPIIAPPTRPTEPTYVDEVELQTVEK